MRKLTYSIFLVFLITFAVYFGFRVNETHAACSIVLLWEVPGRGDFDATQAPPTGVGIGNTIIAKAQFNGCQGDGNKASLGWRTGVGQQYTLVGPQAINNSYLELRANIVINEPVKLEFVATAQSVGGSDFTTQRSQILTVSAPGSGGTSTKYSCNQNKQCVVDPNGEYTSSNCNNKCATATGGENPPTGGNPAGSTTSSGKFDIENPIEADDFGELINLIAKWIFNLSIPVAIIIIIYAGIKMIIAQGNSTKFAAASKMLWYAILGLAVIFIGKGFVSLIQSILNIGK